MLKRIAKRFKREHRAAKVSSRKWVFHAAQWGDLEVSVMPRSIDGRVEDSNTGVVLKAPFHGTLKACVVVNDGSRPNCDEEALNYTLTGSKVKCWMDIPGIHPWCIPHRKVTEQEREDEGYQMAVSAIMEGRGLPREQAQAEADQVLGWCPDSIQCGICHLLIPGLGAKELVTLARSYGWRVILPLQLDSWRCRACAYANSVEIPSDAEMAAICGAEWV